jgi:toxin ParE1/3/4
LEVRFVVSPRAQADIDDIWEYTVGRWGTRQAETYLRLIKEAVEAVATDPRAGRTCDDVRPGYRKYLVGSHVLFYRVTATAVVVVRILHQRVDVERHL